MGRPPSLEALPINKVPPKLNGTTVAASVNNSMSEEGVKEESRKKKQPFHPVRKVSMQKVPLKIPFRGGCDENDFECL